jgi:hypothetical protein
VAILFLAVLLIPVAIFSIPIRADSLPPTVTVKFSDIVLALPAGVNVIYPTGTSSDTLVAVFSRVPSVSSLPCNPLDYPVTIAYVHVCTVTKYLAIPVADSQELTGVKWYILIDNWMAPLSQLGTVSIKYIEIPRIVRKPDSLPPVVLVEFHQILEAFPVGVKISHPNVKSEYPVAVFEGLPVCLLDSDNYPVTVAYVYTCTNRKYLAIPVFDPQEPSKVKWYLVIEKYCLVPISEMQLPISYIEIPRIVVPEFQIAIPVLVVSLLLPFLISRPLSRKK